jgi:membrane protein implicated in regulation of membrane protease activity
MWIAWLALAVVLIAFELQHLAFFALFGAVGAVAGAVVAAIWPEAYAAQVAAFVAVSSIGIVAVRPWMSQSMHRHHDGRLGRGVHGALVGEEVLTLDTVGDARHLGHVRLAGERWLAASGSGQPIPADTIVLVTAVNGTTLTVWPVDGVHPEITAALPDSPPDSPPPRGDQP